MTYKNIRIEVDQELYQMILQQQNILSEQEKRKVPLSGVVVNSLTQGLKRSGQQNIKPQEELSDHPNANNRQQNKPQRKRKSNKKHHSADAQLKHHFNRKISAQSKRLDQKEFELYSREFRLKEQEVRVMRLEQEHNLKVVDVKLTERFLKDREEKTNENILGELQNIMSELKAYRNNDLKKDLKEIRHLLEDVKNQTQRNWFEKSEPYLTPLLSIIGFFTMGTRLFKRRRMKQLQGLATANMNKGNAPLAELIRSIMGAIGRFEEQIKQANTRGKKTQPAEKKTAKPAPQDKQQTGLDNNQRKTQKEQDTLKGFMLNKERIKGLGSELESDQ